MSSDSLRAVLADDVLAGARRLLGCIVVHPSGRARIVETEAYRGLDDPGCHAFGRDRMKNMTLFGPPGHAYVYRSYGIHQMLNVAALPEGIAAGVLIRALRPVDILCEPTSETPTDEFRGPGRLGRALGIGPWLNGLDLLDGSAEIRIETADEASDIYVGPRIGLAVGKGESTPWRFVAGGDLLWVSATRRGLVPTSRPASAGLTP